MRFVVLTGAFLLLFSASSIAQDALTIRQVWCEMDQVTEPAVKDFKSACEKVVSLFPNPQVTATYDMDRKIFMNKMRGVMKRGATWDALSVQARNDLAKQAVEMTNQYLGFEADAPNPQPAEFQRNSIKSVELCGEKKYQYSNVSACYDDLRYIYRNGLSGPMGKSSVMSFWLVIRFIAGQIDCDVK